jgi:hypothetical protein
MRLPKAVSAKPTMLIGPYWASQEGCVKIPADDGPGHQGGGWPQRQAFGLGRRLLLFHGLCHLKGPRDSVAAKSNS